VNLTIKTLLFFFNLLEKINTFFLRIGRQFAWIAIFLMVVVIIIQVFFRYVLNNALPWPDELARFLMLWMTGLIAPSAYRWGGFVSIDILERFLPKILSTLLTIFILFVSLCVLVIGFELGLKHINAGWIFNSSSIKIPFHLIGGKTEPIKLAWMYMSLPVGIVFLISVNIELIFRKILTNFTKLELPEDFDKQKLEVK
jgi:TRAP-type C4-dicarboxylate transport system permease small subunit|tara:strand:- start:1265 stop:1861 length:597 start_codon:yes stop_codon:yes gene_type:complete